MKQFVKWSVILFLSVTLPTLGHAVPMPASLSVAVSNASGNWNSPSTWTWLVNNGNAQGPLTHPNDSTFVIIQSGHTVTLTSNETCEGLSIEEGGVLDNSSYDLLIQFMGWAHIVSDAGVDDGVEYFGFAPINSTWTVNNPANANWCIYKVDGTHAGSGNIIFDWDDGIDRNEYGATVSGTGTITLTGSVYYRSTGGVANGLKFNSACNLDFHCNLNLTDDEYPTSGGGALSAYNFGTINIIDADFTTGAEFGVFTNKPGAVISVQNGSVYLGPATALVVIFYNEGVVNIQNGNLIIPSDSIMFNSFQIIIDGNIHGVDSSNPNCFFLQYAAGAILSVTGEIFPASNTGTLTCTGYSEGINYVIYNGNTLQRITTPNELYMPELKTPYSVLIVDNSAGAFLGSDFSVNDSLILTNGLINLGDYNLTLGQAAFIGGLPSDTAMVVATGTGELRKAFSGPANFLFPVGDSDSISEYSPVNIEFASGTFTDGVVGVKLSNTSYPGTTGNNLNRFWTVSSSGISDFSSNAQFYYNPADVPGIESGIWSYRLEPDTIRFAPADTILHILTAPGLTAFGSFTGLEYYEVFLPLAFAVTGGGSYCTGEDGVLVGLSDSELGVTYTLLMDGIPQEPTIAGTGDSISFGLHTGGFYTIEGSNSAGTVPMTGSAIITENILPNVTWTTFDPDTLCIQWSPVLLTGGTPEGGYYSGNGVTDNYFDPALAGQGSHEITYHYTSEYGCSGEATLTLFVDLCTNVQDLSSLLIIYPNPASTQLNIETNGIMQITVYSASGRPVINNHYTGETNATLNLTGLRSGLYVLRLTDKAGNVKFAEFIKK